MKHPLLALAAALALTAGPVSAQHLSRRPPSNADLLKATAKILGDAPVAVVPAAAVEVAPPSNSESSKLFATKVHAVLMNACAGCHARSDFAGSYKLKRVDEGYANAAGIERNLLATLKQIDRADPGASPFLTKAVTAHGKSRVAPLHSANHPAYRHLELWTNWAAMRDGSPPPSSIPQVAAKRAEPIAPVPPTPKTFAVEVKAAEPICANPDDPFDPAAFNRAAPPMRK